MRTFSFPSRSSDSTHTVTVGANDHISCTCRGFDTPSKCWHVREVAEQLGITMRADSRTAPLPLTEEPTSKWGSGLDAIKSHLEVGFIEPMLARALPEDQTIDDYANDDWVLEEKVDGHRMIVRKAPVTGIVTAWARSGIVRILPRHIIHAAQLLPPGTYDGELHVVGHTSTDVTRIDLQHRLRLTLFDVLHIGAELKGCMHLSLRERRLLLESAVSLLNGDSIVVNPQYRVSQAGLNTIWDRGGEGAVIKDLRMRYQPGKRVPAWVKFKKSQAAEVTVTGFKAGKYGPHSVIVAVDKHGVEVQVKSRNDEWRAYFAQHASEVVGQILVVSFQEKTRDGRLRHPMADHFLNLEVE